MGNVVIMNGTMSFEDVAASAWYYEYVLYAFTNGFIEGYSPTSFLPEGKLTVAEAIKLAACMHQLYNTGSVTLANSEQGPWYGTYLEYAALNGIVSKTYQNYNVQITRSEFVAIFYAALPAKEYDVKNAVADNAIPDVKMSNSNSAQIYAFYRAGILDGVDSVGTFTPSESITRSQVTAIMTRMFEKSMRISLPWA
jgi:hypothetical protein